MPETAIRRIPFPLREGELLRSCHRPPPVRTDRKLSIYERWAQSRCTQCTWIHESNRLKITSTGQPDNALLNASRMCVCSFDAGIQLDCFELGSLQCTDAYMIQRHGFVRTRLSARLDWCETTFFVKNVVHINLSSPLFLIIFFAFTPTWSN